MIATRPRSGPRVPPMDVKTQPEDSGAYSSRVPRLRAVARTMHCNHNSTNPKASQNANAAPLHSDARSNEQETYMNAEARTSL